ncbi:MAG: hypothetical protein AB7O62_21365 [Pirellulales bacterium]
MANEFDPYREALVMEQRTIWPAEFDGWDAGERARLEQRIHAEPQKAAELAYVRQHSGFSREITVTSEDVDRLK